MTRLPKGERLDQLLALTLIAGGLIELFIGSGDPGLSTWLGVPLAVLIGGSVAVRRRWPLAAGSIAILATGVIFIVGAHNYNVALGIAWMCALYAIAVWTDAAGFMVGLAVILASNVLTQVVAPHQKMRDTVQFTVIPLVAMVIIRRAVRDRQLRAEALAARAELLERERELRANQAVAEERARIARELHDLVAHNVSLMVVQAGAERHALPSDQTSTRETLTSIEQAGRQALAEARRLLGMLRRGENRQELEPQPTLDQLDFLVEQVVRAGLPVKLELQGEPRPLPAGLDLCAYRIVQEGLTNALKHAGPAHAEVLLRYTSQALEIHVRDDGRGVQGERVNGTGHGLIGMRERVALYDGQLAAGPRPEGGYEVRATIPLATT